MVISIAASALAFGLIAGASFVGFQHVYYRLNPDAKPVLSNQEPSREIPTLASTPLAQVTSTQEDLVSKLVEQVEPSVVTITSTFVQSYSFFGQQFDNESSGGGSGIIVGQNDTELLIATNNHVVEDASKIAVGFVDGSEGLATIKGRDSVADLAIISVPLDSLSADTRTVIQIAALGDSEDVKVGEMVIAIGNALGYGQSVTVGYVSAKDREVTVDSNTMILLQTDAAINPGNSGGALINTRGEVIGINSVKYAANEVEGIGFAIPISNAYPILNEFMNREVLSEEEKGYLGITIKNVTEELAELYQWPVGVLVYGVTEDGPAARAGILVQDIITKVNGSTVTDMDQLKERVNSLRIGTEVTITLQRYQNGSFTEMEFQVVLAANPQPTAAPTPTPTPEADGTKNGQGGAPGQGRQNDRSGQNGQAESEGGSAD